MAEVDLIPREWRDARRIRRTLACLAAAIAVVGCATALGRFAIFRLAGTERETTRQLLQQKTQVRTHAGKLRTLEQKRDEIAKQLAQIQALTAGRLTRDVLLPIDRALNERIWFDELAYTRTASDPKPVGGRTADVPPVGFIELRGRALDHASLAAFVEALGAQPQLRDVRLTSTRVRRYTEVQVLDFALEAALADRDGSRS